MNYVGKKELKLLKVMQSQKYREAFLDKWIFCEHGGVKRKSRA
jgi:hypothetical protein